MNPVPTGTALAVLTTENSYSRFERFANSWVSRHEGDVPVWSTSPSWDLGVDGRGAGRSGLYVCSSLRDDFERKAQEDITRVLGTTETIRTLYFASSQPLSEDRIAKIRSELQALEKRVRKTRVIHFEVVGGYQLVEEDYLRALEGSAPLMIRFYKAEVEEALRALDGSPGKEVEEEALKLALIAMTEETVIEAKQTVLRMLLLDALSAHAKDGVGTATLGREASAKLRLGRSLPSTMLNVALADLCKAGLAQHSDEKYRITAAGVAEREKATAAALNEWADGRSKCRASLEEKLGRALSDPQFLKVWNAIEDGRAVVDTVAAVLNGEKKSAPPPNFQKLVESLAVRANHVVADPDGKAEIKLAVTAMFSDAAGPAWQWLSRACAGYVAICSLGLEQHSGAYIRKAILGIDVVLDTDVVLSILCDGEPSHRALVQAAERWVAEGGRLFTTKGVYREVGHHAWIAQNDFDETRGLLPGEPERDDLFGNAFVRSFAVRMRAGTVGGVDSWPHYIAEYRGRTKQDSSLVERILEDDFKVQVLSPAGQDYQELKSRVLENLQVEVSDKQNLSGTEEQRRQYIRYDLAQRDAELVAQIVERRDTVRRSGKQGTCCLVSSSTRLQRSSSALRAADAQVPLVMLPGAWLFMMSMLPGLSLTLDAMKSFLFDGSVSSRPTGLEQSVLRAVAATGEYRIHVARRATLWRNLQDAIFRTARKMGTTKDEIEEMIENPTTSEAIRTSTSILADALKESGVSSSAQEEIERLQRRIRELESRK